MHGEAYLLDFDHEIYDEAVTLEFVQRLRDEQRYDSVQALVAQSDTGARRAGGWAGTPRLVPESRMKDFQMPPRTIPRSIGHHAEWIQACKGGPKPFSPFSIGGPPAP